MMHREQVLRGRTALSPEDRAYVAAALEDSLSVAPAGPEAQEASRCAAGGIAVSLGCLSSRCDARQRRDRSARPATWAASGQGQAVRWQSDGPEAAGYRFMRRASVLLISLFPAFSL